MKTTLNLEQVPADIRKHINQLERVRQDFVANVSHELRTPLTVLRGYLETLISKDDEEIEKYQKIFEQMYQHSLRMENIIGDLLLLSRLENDDQPSDENHAVPVAELLTTLCGDAKIISGEKHHAINLELMPELCLKGSDEELKSLFSNFIVNAVKYTPANGIIKVSWQVENGQAAFSVSDTGIGIDEKHIPRITERFYRVDKARSRDSGGTGLGLAIAKHVLMRHQGELSVESKLGEGSTFKCVFPTIRTVIAD